MSIHIHTGPGHHERILTDELTNREYEFTFTNYHPEYCLSKSSKGKSIIIKNSRIYNIARWFIWGLSNRIPLFRRGNRHLNFIYPVYDFLTSLFISPNTSMLFGWAQVSLITMRKVKKRGGIVVLDYPIPHILKWQNLLREEAELCSIPELRSLFSNSMVKRMLKEIDIADYISVPSQFVANSFIEYGVPRSKLIFNSYGIDTALFNPKSTQRKKATFTIIFVGSIEYRKGVHYLLKAMDLLKSNDVELKIIGTIQSDFIDLHNEYKDKNNLKWLGQLSKAEISDELNNADIMVMPSILEGLSLTILEAMACGLPVISTTNAGGDGVIEDYQEGFVVPIRSPEAISERIKWCLDNREEVREMGVKARSKSINYYGSKNYVDRFVEKILKLKNE